MNFSGLAAPVKICPVMIRSEARVVAEVRPVSTQQIVRQGFRRASRAEDRNELLGLSGAGEDLPSDDQIGSASRRGSPPSVDSADSPAGIPPRFPSGGPE